MSGGLSLPALWWGDSYAQAENRGDVVAEERECMCLECGVSTYLPLDQISLEDPASTEARLLSDLCICAECGGRLLLVGRAGDEPHYRTK